MPDKSPLAYLPRDKAEQMVMLTVLCTLVKKLVGFSVNCVNIEAF